MAKGFKLPRGNKLTLGHNGQIKPITTRFAGDGVDIPLKQTDVPWSGGEVVESGDPNTLRVQRDRFVGAEYVPTSGDASLLPKGEGPFENPAVPGQTYDEFIDAPCGSPGKPWGQGMCPDEPEPSGDPESEHQDITGSTENPSFNVLTPHLRRRNARMRQGAGRQDQRAIDAANRRVRKALRRGNEPMEQDIEILSGIGLGSWEGFDPNQMTSGNINMFGYRTPRYSGKGGSTHLTQGQMNAQLQAIITANPGMEPWEAKDILNAQLAAGGGISGSANYTGMHIDDRTAKLMKKRGYDLSNYNIDPRALELKKRRNPNRIDQGGEGTAVGNFLRKIVGKAEDEGEKLLKGKKKKKK